MYKREEYVERIRSIMPAPEWMVWTCFIDDDGTVKFDEEAVVGWGVKGYEPINPELDDITERRDDEVVLLVMLRGEGCVQALDDVSTGSDWLTEAVGPEGLTEARKAQMENMLRTSMRMRAEFKQKKEAALAAAK